MVVGTAPEREVGILPPVIPLFINQRRSYYNYAPRASADWQPNNNGSVPSGTPGSKPANPVHNLTNHITKFSLGFGTGSGIYFASSQAAKAFSLWPFGGRGKKGDAAEDGVKRILIMMSNTGGGHKASAEALKAAFRELYGNKYEIDIVDMWKEHTPYPFNELPNSYSFLVKHGILWRASYMLTNPRLIHVPYLSAVSLICSQHLRDAFKSYNPDLVVSVHPLMQHTPIKVMKDLIKDGSIKPINFATVITDFTTCHNTWFHPEATRCFVPTEFCKNLGLSLGLKEEQLVLHGLPIRPVFSKPLPNKTTMKKRMGLDTSVPAILLIGGGEGMGKLEETVKELERKLGNSCQVVVICGRNKELLNRLEAVEFASGMKVHPRGFVDNIHEWMGACDLVITKAGPGTIAEALISGLPILLNGNVPCQEEGNIPYVIDNKVGAFETDPAKIATIIQQWLGPMREEFDRMGARAKALGKPEAVYNIVRDLAKLAQQPFTDFGPARAAPASRLPVTPITA